MAAFDLNNLYFLKNNAPKTSEFNDVMGSVENGFNLGTKYNESYNNNSLDALVAQRESEGIPFDRLSNEMAKFGSQGREAALKARDERRTSIDTNYKWQKDKFDTWRKNMARRICGEILQIADQMGIGGEERSRVLEIAADYVVTYDEALANQLRSEARARTIAQNKLNKPYEQKDHEKEISDLISKAADPKGDLESDPNAGRLREKLKVVAQRLLDWKNANPYNYVNNPEGRLIYKRMISSLLSQPNPSALTDDQVSALVQNASTEDSYGDQEVQGFVDRARRKGRSKSGNAQNAYGLKPIAKISDSGSGAWVVNSNTLQDLSDFVNDLESTDMDFKDKLKAARNVISGGSVIKDNDMKSQAFNPINEVLSQKEKEYNEYVKELKNLGVTDPEDAFKKFKSLFGTRASMGTVIQFRNFNSFVNSYLSHAPLTAVSSGLLVGTPAYKPTVSEINAAKRVHGKWTDEVRNVIRDLKVPIASTVADAKTDYEALWALGQDVEQQIRGLWDSITGNKTPEEKAKMKELYTNLFHIDNNAWSIIEGQSFPVGEEYHQQLAIKDKKKKTGKTANLSGGEASVSSGESKPGNENSVDESKVSAVLEALRAAKEESK